MGQYSKYPQYKSMDLMAKALGDKFPKHSFLIQTEIWKHSHSTTSGTNVKFGLFILPGDDGSSCSVLSNLTWKGLIGTVSELLAREEITHV